MMKSRFSAAPRNSYSTRAQPGQPHSAPRSAPCLLTSTASSAPSSSSTALLSAMPASLLQPLLAALVPLDGGDGDSPLPNDPRRPFEGPWLQQQLFLSLGIGLTSLLLFSLSRRRYPTLFAPRTKLAGFTPHVANLDAGVFAWIMPTLRTPEPRILHIVGLDAAVLLAFFKTCFWVLTVLSLW